VEMILQPLMLQIGAVLPTVVAPHRNHTESTQRAHREHTESTQRAHREHTESTQRVHRKHTESTQKVHRKYTHTHILSCMSCTHRQTHMRRMCFLFLALFRVVCLEERMPLPRPLPRSTPLRLLLRAMKLPPLHTQLEIVLAQLHSSTAKGGGEGGSKGSAVAHAADASAAATTVAADIAPLPLLAAPAVLWSQFRVSFGLAADTGCWDLVRHHECAVFMGVLCHGCAGAVFFITPHLTPSHPKYPSIRTSQHSTEYNII
jgi:hypothetical protein